MDAFTQRLDAITLASLRAIGGTKWASEDDTIGAFVAEMDFGIAPPITAALHHAVYEGGFGYMPDKLVTALQSATAQMYRRDHGWNLDPADVRHVPDVIKALEMAIEEHSAPGSKVIVPTPSYMPFLLVPPMMGREVIQVPLAERDGRPVFDMERLQAGFDAGANLLILCNPYNPVGRVFERSELEAIAALVDANKGRVFADEIWAPLVYPGNCHIPYASINETAAGHTITAVSASKAWNLPGLKCAQVITSNDADRAIWDRIGHFAGHGTANLGVVGNVTAYREGGEWVGKVLAYLDRNRQALTGLVAEHLPGVRYSQPEGTYVAWLDFRDTALAEKPANFFKEKAQVQLTDGASCGAGFGGFARFIFATPQPIMVTAFERMGKAMKGL